MSFSGCLGVVRQVCKFQVKHWKFLLQGLWLSDVTKDVTEGGRGLAEGDRTVP